MHFVFLSLLLVQFEHCSSIFLLHFPDATVNGDTLLIWKTIPRLKLLHSEALWQISVFYLNQLFHVYEPVQIMGCAEWSGLRMTRRVERLRVPKHSLSSHHF